MSKDKRCQEEIMCDRAVDLLARNKQQAKQIKSLKAGNDAAKNEIAEIEKELDKLRTSQSDALEQIWNKLKLVKIHFC